MIGTFPDFRSPEPDHAEVIRALQPGHLHYSDFHLSNLWMWNLDGSTKICELNGNLAVQVLDYTGTEMVLTFSGSREVDRTIGTLLSYATDVEGFKPRLEYVHDASISELEDPNRFEIVEERHNFDYFYAVEDVLTLRGTRRSIQVRRQQRRRFNAENEGRISSGLVDLQSRSVRTELVQLFDVWRDSRALDAGAVEEERQAVLRLMELAGVIDLHCVCLRLDDQLIGFSVLEAIGNSAISSVAKADVSVRDVYPYLDFCVAEALNSLGIETVNYEQDLGIEGLRTAKSRIGLHSFLKKYSVGLPV